MTPLPRTGHWGPGRQGRPPTLVLLATRWSTPEQGAGAQKGRKAAIAPCTPKWPNDTSRMGVEADVVWASLYRLPRTGGTSCSCACT